jgi:hypothetical protein
MSDPTADAERLLQEWSPTEEEAMFIREQAKAIYDGVLSAFTKQRGRMRPGALEMAIAYPSFWAAEWVARTEQSESEPQD